MTEKTGPIVEYDLQIAGLYFEGTEEDSFDDMRAAAKEDLDTLAELVEQLKEIDQEHERTLQEAMQSEEPQATDSSGGTSHYQ